MQFVCVIIVVVVYPVLIHAHGINAHVWVTDQAIEYQENCELVKFFSEKEVREAAQIASGFPDSGYAAKHKYGETAHWEPFTEAYIQYLRKKGMGFLSTAEGRKQTAFLIGLSSHGYEDEIFDSIFMYKTSEMDGYASDKVQNILDTGLDLIMISDGVTKLQPPLYFPAEDLVQVFTSPAVGVSVTEDDFKRGMWTVKNIVIALAKARKRIDAGYYDKLPWAREHYLDADTSGSFAFEPFVIRRYHQALWNRLHGEFDEKDLLIYSVPPPGSRLKSTRHDTVDSWITLFLGYGIDDKTINEANVKLTDNDGHVISAAVKPNRWGGDGYSRLLQVRPKVDLEYDKEYVVALSKNMKLITGEAVPHDIIFRFKTHCDPAKKTAACSVHEPVLEKPHCGG